MTAPRHDGSGGRALPGLLLWGGLTALAAAAGSAASVRSRLLYTELERPAWAPPAAAFAPVWTALYILMALAAFLVWRARGWRGARTALTLYVVQLVLNALWTWIFFVQRNGALAFAEIVALLVAIVATLAAFWRIRPAAGALLLPYLAWVAFATALTWAVWRGNPGVL